MIEIKDVMKSFENKNVLNHLNLTISSGSIFGLIGPNGAGKSTLLYLLNGISKCDEGSILFDGKDVYPFITHEGSGFGRSLQDLKTIIPHAYIHEGLAIFGHQVYESEDKVKSWVGE